VVAFNTMYSASNICLYGTWASDVYTNYVFSVNLSYLGGLLSYIPIQRTDRVMSAHNRVETSCILCYQFSIPTSDFNVHELMLLQLSALSAVGLK
jgi:hypothetical protein